MTLASNKRVISCAITGSIHLPTMTPYLPITPDQIAQNALDAADAGAAIVHIHARNPETGQPSRHDAREPVPERDVFRARGGGRERQDVLKAHPECRQYRQRPKRLKIIRPLGAGAVSVDDLGDGNAQLLPGRDDIGRLNDKL